METRSESSRIWTALENTIVSFRRGVTDLAQNRTLVPALSERGDMVNISIGTGSAEAQKGRLCRSEWLKLLRQRRKLRDSVETGNIAFVGVSFGD